jgi:predicted membrane protein
METPNTSYNRGPQIEKPSSSFPKFNGRAMGGLIIILVGSALLLRQLDIPMPHWLFSWQMILIVIGLFSGVRHSFKGWSWTVPIFIGLIFLADHLIDDFHFHRFFWPVMIIGFGLYMILKPKKKGGMYWVAEDSDETMLDATAIFGGVKKNIITKDFKGGEVTSLFGGSEIILSQADINGRVGLDITTLFGGSKIIVPANWQINSDGLVAIFGGMEDKRAIQANPLPDPNKILVIKGLVMFGAIEIKSF